MKDSLSDFVRWVRLSSLLLGFPCLLVVMSWSVSRVLFTGTCLVAGYKCRFALSTEAVMSQYLENLLGGEAELVVSPSRQTR